MLAIQVDLRSGAGWTTLQSHGQAVDDAAWQLVHLTDRPQMVYGNPADYRAICDSEATALDVYTATRCACVIQEPARDDFPKYWTVAISNA